MAVLRSSGAIRQLAEQRDEITHRGRSIMLTGPRCEWPPAEWIEAVWAFARRGRGAGSRPAALVTLALACWLLAADGRVGCSLAELRRVVGASHGGAWNSRLDELEALGILRRAGAQWKDGIIVVADLGSESAVRSATGSITERTELPPARVRVIAARTEVARTRRVGNGVVMSASAAAVAEADRWPVIDDDPGVETLVLDADDIPIESRPQLYAVGG